MTRRELLRNGAQLAGLWGFAVAQPLFEVVKSGELFVIVGWRGGDLVGLALVTAFAAPLAMVVVEALTARFSERAAEVLHLVFVGLVAAVFALYALKKQTDAGDGVALAIGIAAGAAAAALFARAEPVRLFATVISPASLLFVLLFLFGSPIRHLVLPADGADLSGPKPATPVVMIVLDEFPTMSLLDGRGELDGRSYPTFARLAREGTWFRNATTVADLTPLAVPAITTGRNQDGERPGSRSAHPNNVIALLAERGGADVRETITRLCPREHCPENEPAELPGRVTRVGRYLAKLSVDTWMPDSLARRIEVTHPFPPAVPEQYFERFARKPAAIHYLHEQLPHQEWRRLPSGQMYTDPGILAEDYTSDGAWTRDRSRVTFFLQRHLAQVRATDAIVGRTLDRMRASGLYDRALVIVTADHGVAFRPGRHVRLLDETNAPGILFVPLFVKLPGQREGRTDERLARTIDIVPTIADVLRIRLPWKADGSSLLGPESAARRRLLAHNVDRKKRFEFDGATLLRRLHGEAAEQAAFFHGNDPDRIFRVGRYGRLVGRRVASLPRGPAAPLRYGVLGGRMLRVPGPHGSVPAMVVGTIEGERAAEQELALVVRGEIAATARSHPSGSGARFEALLRDRTLRDGDNPLEVYAISGSPERPRLAPLTPDQR